MASAIFVVETRYNVPTTYTRYRWYRSLIPKLNNFKITFGNGISNINYYDLCPNIYRWTSSLSRAIIQKKKWNSVVKYYNTFVNDFSISIAIRIDFGLDSENYMQGK